MYQNSDFSEYGCRVDEVFDLAQNEDQYYIAPQVTTSGSTLPEFAYNSVEHVQPNSQALYPVLSVPHGGTTFYYYPDVVLIPVYYFVPVAFVYQEPIVYENPSLIEDHLDEIRHDYACNDHQEESRISDSYDGGYVAEDRVSPAMSTFFSYSENAEKLLDAPVINDRENDSSPEKKSYRDEIQSPVSRDKVEESSAFRKFCSTVEDRRKILSDSPVVKKTYINRGIVKDPASYRDFCRGVEQVIKKQSDSSVVKKTYINRGIVKDPASYRDFCRGVEQGIKKKRSIENSPSSRPKEFIAKENSKIGDAIHEVDGQHFMDMILKSAEYLHVQDNITNPKHYRDRLYKQALLNNPRRTQATLFDILPVISEESFIFDDVTAEASCGDLREIEPQELVSEDGIAKPKQRKGRWKSFRNWWSKKFFCCCRTKDPP